MVFAMLWLFTPPPVKETRVVRTLALLDTRSTGACTLEVAEPWALAVGLRFLFRMGGKPVRPGALGKAGVSGSPWGKRVRPGA